MKRHEKNDKVTSHVSKLLHSSNIILHVAYIQGDDETSISGLVATHPSRMQNISQSFPRDSCGDS